MRITISVLMLLLIFSCESDDDTSLFIIDGQVDLFSELSAFPSLPSSEGVTVTLLSADTEVLDRSITSDDGLFRFEVNNANDGPFTITFEKPLFSYYKTRPFEFEESREFYSIILSEKSTIEVLDFDVEVLDPIEGSTSGSTNFTLKTTPLFILANEEFDKRHFRIFIHNDSDLSPENYSYSISYSPSNDETRDFLEQTEDYTMLESNNSRLITSEWPSGSRVFIQIFGSTELEVSYYNESIDKPVYSSLSDKGSEIVEVVVP